MQIPPIGNNRLEVDFSRTGTDVLANSIIGFSNGHKFTFFPPGRLNIQQREVMEKIQFFLDFALNKARTENRTDVAQFTKARVAVSDKGRVAVHVHGKEGKLYTFEDKKGELREKAGELIELAKLSFPQLLFAPAEKELFKSNEDAEQVASQERAAPRARTYKVQPQLDVGEGTSKDAVRRRRAGLQAPIAQKNVNRLSSELKESDKVRRRQEKEAALHERIIQEDIKAKRKKSNL